MQSFVFHPATTFGFGVLGALVVLILCLVSCSGTNDSVAKVESYREAKGKAGSDGPAPGTTAEKEAQERIGQFLAHLGTKSYLEEETARTYAEGAYFNDKHVKYAA